MTQPCTRCRENPSIYHRPYSGERLCQLCFTITIKEKVRHTIARHDMLEYDSRIALGLSGGKDSIALLEILHTLQQAHPRSTLIAISIDEGVGDYRDEALRLATQATKRLGVEHHLTSFKKLFGYSMDEISAIPKEFNACTYCGVLRRRALNTAAQDIDSDRLATAHNLDDMAQTALLNILRGDTNRLSQIDPGGHNLPGFVRRIKPFAEIPEKESTLYAYLTGIQFQAIPCPYADESMRNDARGILNRLEYKRPGTKHTIYRTALKISPNFQTRKPLTNCSTCGEPSSDHLCRACQLIQGLTLDPRKHTFNFQAQG
ncbi:MAG: TIGR00269 family protein [Candidatus Bathyarchaeota archaeon]|jgi:uncharacterized protein (TIGR00269 family)|nr:TIGR00269 family protein [Candidatus Bathyarchaeota archaeon]